MRSAFALVGSLMLLSAVGTVGCSTPRKPAQEVAKADLAIASANKSGAPTDAPLELQLAREKAEKAKSALQSNDFKLARRFAEQAQVDAQLAEAKAESESARASAAELEHTIDVLRDEAERGIGSPR
ncbi:MAG: DUF4398 domain-containing protein [Myxococcota bacterium]